MRFGFDKNFNIHVMCFFFCFHANKLNLTSHINIMFQIDLKSYYTRKDKIIRNNNYNNNNNTCCIAQMEGMFVNIPNNYVKKMTIKIFFFLNNRKFFFSRWYTRSRKVTKISCTRKKKNCINNRMNNSFFPIK